MSKRIVRFSMMAVFFSIGSLAAPGASATPGDVKAGEKVFKKCRACHTVGPEAKHKVGPILNNIVNRQAGTVEGYKYSNAVKEAGSEGLTWTEEKLDLFLTKPKKMIPKTKMAYNGLKKEKDRVNLIAYLKTYSDTSSETGETQSKKVDDNSQTVALKPEIDNSPPEFTEEFLADSANFEAGKEMWFAQCTHCHGFKAYPGKAPKLKPKKYKPGFVYRRTFKGFKKMPSWKEIFTKKEIMQIVAYVKSDKFSP